VTPLAVSMGDPAGIGPEILLKAWSALRRGGPTFFLIGAPEALAPLQQERRFRAPNPTKSGPDIIDDALEADAPIAVIAAPSDAAACFSHALPVLPLRLTTPVQPGRPDPSHAQAIIEAIRLGVQLCLREEASGLVTLPIAKAALYGAGFGFPGHTEFIADLCGASNPVMMLAGPSLRVALATIHTPLRLVPDQLSAARIETVARVTLEALQRDFGIAAPRLALAGLNPHAGEGGAIGREEIETINPAAAALRAQGWRVTDAQPADSLFHAEARAGYDAVVAMTHDQGLIPIKTLHFWDAVNLTLGLPIVRASPDHGTGFDIAGRGVARPDSLIAALRLADEIARRRIAATAS